MPFLHFEITVLAVDGKIADRKLIEIIVCLLSNCTCLLQCVALL